MIPTARQTFLEYNTHGFDCKCGCQDGGNRATRAMVVFAQRHVEAALKAAAENAELKPYPYNSCYECGRSDMDVDKKSILNSYPLENIK